MKVILAVVFAMSTVVCGLGWFFTVISCETLAQYIMDKGYDPPTREDIHRCNSKVIDKRFRNEKKIIR